MDLLPLAARVVARKGFIDVTFDKPPVALDSFTFKNFYVNSITVLHTHRTQLDSAASSASPWTPVLAEYRLMQDPQYEDDAEASFTIHSSEFEDGFFAEQTTFIRIYLDQPSSRWKEHTLHDLRFFTQCGDRNLTLNSPSIYSLPENMDKSFARALDGVTHLSREARDVMTDFISSRKVVKNGAHPYVVGEFSDVIVLRDE